MVEHELHLLIEDFLRIGHLGEALVEDAADGAVHVVRGGNLTAPVLDELLVEVLQKPLGRTLDGLAILIRQRRDRLGEQIEDCEFLLGETLADCAALLLGERA